VKAEGTIISWDNSDYALLWAVCKDGKVVAFTQEPTLDIDSYGNGSYTVRAANDMGGLSAQSQAVTISDTGIAELTADGSTTVVSAAYYTIDGKRLSILQRGVNIIRQTMADGTTKTIKVVR
jgi:hypothetical protein